MFLFYREICKLGRKIAGCICFLLIIGPILIVAGGLVLANAGKYSRTDAINSYNGAVSAWMSNGYAAFQKYSGATLEFNSGTPFTGYSVSRPVVRRGMRKAALSRLPRFHLCFPSPLFAAEQLPRR